MPRCDGRRAKRRNSVSGQTLAPAPEPVWSIVLTAARSGRSVVEHDVEQRAVDLQPAVVLDEAQLPELVHEEADRERVVPTISASVSWLIFGTTALRPAFLAEVGQQQEDPGEPLLAGVEELVHEVFFDPDVPRQQIRRERSENSASSWSARSIAGFGSTTIELSVVAVAVDMRSGWPARHPSPKKSPGPRSAMTACLPCCERTVSLTFPSLDEEHGVRAITLREDRLALAVLPGRLVEHPPTPAMPWDRLATSPSASSTASYKKNASASRDRGRGRGLRAPCTHPRGARGAAAYTRHHAPARRRGDRARGAGAPAARAACARRSRACARNPAWARRLGGAAAGDIKRVDDWRRLPFLTKDDLRDAYPLGLACGALEGYRRVHMSSGTTGNPILNPYTAADVAQWGEVMARCYVAAGVTRDDVIQITPSFGLFTGGFGFHYGAERLGAMVIPTGAGRTLLQLRLMRDLGATVLPAIATYPLRLHRGRARGAVRPRRRSRCASASSAPRCGRTSCARASSASSRSAPSTSSA